MPALNTYDVEITLVQKGIRAETAVDAIAVMESNIQIKTYVKPVRTVAEKVS